MKIRNKKWILLCMLVFTLLLVTACAGSTALKDDLKNTTKKEIHTLKYEAPQNWVKHNKPGIDKSLYKKFQGLVRWGDDKEYLGNIEVYYLGDDALPLDLEGDGIKKRKDETESVKIGKTEVDVSVYDKNLNDDKERAVYSASFTKDYSTFLFLMDSPNGDKDLSFFKDFLERIDLDAYKNPRTAKKLTAKYTGSKNPGKRITSDSEDVKVTVEYDNGDKENAKLWELDKDIKIVSGKQTSGTVRCHGLSCKLKVTGEKPVKLKVKYTGPTTAGTTIEKENIEVYAVYKNGKKSKVYDYKLKNHPTLKADGKSRVKITYGGLSHELEVVCTTVSPGKKNALRSAEMYLNSSAFSKTGLIKQLKYEGYKEAEAKYAVDHCSADWKEQAYKSAKQYLKTMSFSKSGLYDQLKYEGFTDEQARYGVDKAYK